MDKAQLKQHVLNTIKGYLTSIGWPDNVSNDRVMSELRNMWKVLEDKGLDKECEKHGLGYAKFVEAAVKKRQEKEILDQMFKKGWVR
jgi:hypothetical protein